MTCFNICLQPIKAGDANFAMEMFVFADSTLLLTTMGSHCMIILLSDIPPFRAARSGIEGLSAFCRNCRCKTQKNAVLCASVVKQWNVRWSTVALKGHLAIIIYYSYQHLWIGEGGSSAAVKALLVVKVLWWLSTQLRGEAFMCCGPGDAPETGFKKQLWKFLTL